MVGLNASEIVEGLSFGMREVVITVAKNNCRDSCVCCALTNSCIEVVVGTT